MVKNLPAMQETWVGSLGWEHSLEEGMATLLQYSGLENSTNRSLEGYTVHGVAKSWTQLNDLALLSLTLLICKLKLEILFH